MRQLLAILLLLSMALPNSVWAGVMTCVAAPTEACQIVKVAPHCPCCKPDTCACAPAPQQPPSKQLPSLPNRSLAASELFLPTEILTVHAPQLDRCLRAGLKPDQHQALSRLGQSVPLYRRHCAVLC